MEETESGKGDTAPRMTEDIATEQGDNLAVERAKKRRGKFSIHFFCCPMPHYSKCHSILMTGLPKGPQAPPGPPTRLSTRLSASASSSHPQISSNNTLPATNDVSHPANVPRTTHSSLKSTSRNIQTTPGSVSSPSKSKQATATANKRTTGSASKKAKQSGGKD